MVKDLKGMITSLQPCTKKALNRIKMAVGEALINVLAL